MMKHCFVFIHDPGSGFFRGGLSRPERAGEVGDGAGGWSEAMTVGGGGRSGPDGAGGGRFRPVSGLKSPESEAMTLFFAVRPEREPSNGVLPSRTRPKRRFPREFSTFSTFSGSFARFPTPD